MWNGAITGSSSRTVLRCQGDDIQKPWPVPGICLVLSKGSGGVDGNPGNKGSSLSCRHSHGRFFTGLDTGVCSPHTVPDVEQSSGSSSASFRSWGLSKRMSYWPQVILKQTPNFSFLCLLAYAWHPAILSHQTLSQEATFRLISPLNLIPFWKHRWSSLLPMPLSSPALSPQISDMLSNDGISCGNMREKGVRVYALSPISDAAPGTHSCSLTLRWWFFGTSHISPSHPHPILFQKLHPTPCCNTIMPEI